MKTLSVAVESPILRFHYQNLFSRRMGFSKTDMLRCCLFLGIFDCFAFVRCDGGTCGDLPIIPHATLDTKGKEPPFDLGVQIPLKCDLGFISGGKRLQLECVTEEGTAVWKLDESEPCSPRSCGFPGNIENAQRVGNVFSFPNNVTYTCNEGFKLRGRSVVFCLASGNWGPSLPSCEAITCPPPDDLENGRVIISDRNYGSIAAYECDKGFSLEGQDHRTCGKESLWSDQAPLCKVSKCLLPDKLENGKIIYKRDNYKFNDLVIFVCNSGGQRRSSKCLDKGIWSSNPPICPGPATTAIPITSPSDSSFGTDGPSSQASSFGTDGPSSPASSLGTDEPSSPASYFGTDGPSSPASYFGTDGPSSPASYFGTDGLSSPASSFGTDAPTIAAVGSTKTNEPFIPNVGSTTGDISTSFLNSTNSSTKFTPNVGDRKDFCLEEITGFSARDGNNLKWPTTRGGTTALSLPPCFKEDRIPVMRRCLWNSGGDVPFWDVVDGTCRKMHRSDLTLSLGNLSQMIVDERNSLEIAERLRNITANFEALEPVDLHFVATTLQNIAHSSFKGREVISSVDQTYNYIMRMDPSALHATESSAFNLSNRILESLETVAATGFLDNENKFVGKTIVFQTWNLGDGLIPLGIAVNSFGNVRTLFSGKENVGDDDNIEAAILLPQGLISRDPSSSIKYSLTFIISKNPSLFHDKGNLTANSYLLHVKINQKYIRNLEEPVEMIFEPFNGSANIIPKLSCGFWEESLNGNFGGWSTEGCQFTYSGRFTCRCDRLGNFALLVSSEQNEKAGEGHRFSLETVTYVGCGVAIFGLTATVLTCLLFREHRKENKHQIRLNMCISLIAILVTFLAGIERKDSKIICRVVAVLLNYFWIVTFSWMFIEFLILRHVKDLAVHRFMKISFLFAWGTPLLVTLLTFLMLHHMYDISCWDFGNAFLYSLTIPVGVLLVADAILLVLILLNTTKAISLPSNKETKVHNSSRLRTSLCTLFLLGLSWIFGLMSLTEKTPVYQHLFAFSIGFLGIFFFLLSVQKERAVLGMRKNSL